VDRLHCTLNDEQVLMVNKWPLIGIVNHLVLKSANKLGGCKNDLDLAE